ncbi:MAG TPA: dienelactone hydrolase family protein [Pyrinomonadaceae bacterium]|nr:dienelactone hydrolase family protein [Pyrinomonadaceae bacterium]
MEARTKTIIDAYRDGALDRRSFIARLIAVTGSMAAAHMLLETTGLASTLISEKESKQAGLTSSDVTYAGADGVSLGGYLSAPSGKGKHPAVLVIHENRGLNEHTRDVARRFAAEGFVALAPDILARKGGTASMASPDKAREAIGTISSEQAMSDLKAGLAYLDKHARVKSGRLGSVGFCWGGARSFLLAAEAERLRGSVVFYGSAPPPEKLAQVRVPVLGLYGETDERITSQVPTVAETLKKAGKKFEYKIYPGAAHAFFNDTGERYNADAAKDAWARTLAFFRSTLK